MRYRVVIVIVFVIFLLTAVAGFGGRPAGLLRSTSPQKTGIMPVRLVSMWSGWEED